LRFEPPLRFRPAFAERLALRLLCPPRLAVAFRLDRPPLRLAVACWRLEPERDRLAL
jgi:hypothetical protein